MKSNANTTEKWYETEVGSQVTSKKYFYEGENFNDFTNRVSSVFSNVFMQRSIKSAIKDADFFLAGRSLYALGCKGKFRASTSNCYILPSPQDNTDSINDVIGKMENIFKSGGGCGVNISNLRPRGSKVMNSARTSTGAVSFMAKFDISAQTIGANNRRAALIIGLNCDHPDIEEFLEVKKNNTAIQAANISILFTDDFMSAVELNENFELKFDVIATGERISKSINAKDFFMKFCAAQWDWCEPGALFIDTVRLRNFMSGYLKSEYNIEISNPCAEYTGAEYNACNLASINLYNIISNPFTKDACIDYAKFGELIKLGVRALDEVLDYGYDLQPLQGNKDAVTDYRAIGLGIFGLADMFVALGVRYGSTQSTEIVDGLMDFMQNAAVTESCMLAQEKGSFAKYDYQKIRDSEMFRELPNDAQELIKEHGLRNNSILSIAPTGSLATMSGLSGGVEPYFAVSYERTTHSLEKEGKFFKVFGLAVKHLLIHDGYTPEAIDAMTNEEIKAKYPYIVDAYDITPAERIGVQATMQQYVDNAISSTLNMKESTTVQDVFDAYLLAWKHGCKGMTIFRQNCKRIAILSKPKESAANIVKFDSITPIKRKTIKKVHGTTVTRHTACAPNMYITVNKHGKHILEVLTNTSTGCSSNINTITRMASLALRSGVKINEIVAELRSNTCPACTNVMAKGGKGISISCGAAIASAIDEVYLDIRPVDEFMEPAGKLLECPQCHKFTLPPEAKCPTCSNCSWSKCE